MHSFLKALRNNAMNFSNGVIIPENWLIIDKEISSALGRELRYIKPQRRHWKYSKELDTVLYSKSLTDAIKAASFDEHRGQDVFYSVKHGLKKLFIQYRLLDFL